MKKKLFILLFGTVLIMVLGVVLSSSINQAPIAIPNANYSTISINCSGLEVGDYANIEWRGYTTDCEGYNSDWCSDEGTQYFDSNGHLTMNLIGGYSLGYLEARIWITEIGAECVYHEYKDVGYHVPDDPCNTCTVSLVFNIPYPYYCPEQ